MTEYMLDCSWARHGWKAVKDAGFSTVSLYLSNDQTKNCKPADVAGLHAAGLALVLNWESDSGRPKAGASAGAADAAAANAQADALGYPPNCAIYLSCDTDASLAEVTPYYRAAAMASKRPIGAYGGAVVVVGLINTAVTKFAWVANAGSWDHGMGDAGAHLHQHYHTHNVLPTPAGWPLNQYDESVVLNPNHGQWGGTTPPKDDFLMGLSDTDQIKLVANIAEIHDAVVNWLMSIEIDGGYANRGKSTPRTQQILALVSALHGANGTTDPKALADAVVQNLSPAVAKSVADEIAKRLAA